MNRKYLFLIPVIVLLVSLVFSTPEVQEQVERSLPGIPLVKPPAYVLAAGEDFGDPLTTANIGLFMYYYDSAGFTLADTVAAWQSYEDHTSYYDGYVRVWNDVNSSSFAGDDVYIDVACRLTSDGWILAWLNRTDSSLKHLVFWGRDFYVGKDIDPSPFSDYDTGDLPRAPMNRTCLFRALERIYYAHDGDFSDVPSQNSVYYYDYEHSTSTILIIIGIGVCDESSVEHHTTSNTMYYTIPDGFTVDFAYRTQFIGSTASLAVQGRVYFDSVEEESSSASEPEHTGSEVEAAYKTVGVQHSVQVWAMDDYVNPNHVHGISVCSVIFWMHET